MLVDCWLFYFCCILKTLFFVSVYPTPLIVFLSAINDSLILLARAPISASGQVCSHYCYNVRFFCLFCFSTSYFACSVFTYALPAALGYCKTKLSCLRPTSCMRGLRPRHVIFLCHSASLRVVWAVCAVRSWRLRPLVLRRAFVACAGFAHGTWFFWLVLCIGHAWFCLRFLLLLACFLCIPCGLMVATKPTWESTREIPLLRTIRTGYSERGCL